MNADLAFDVLWLFALLQLKHFVIDWWLQPPWMWQNKGTYGHPGGLAHAAFNAIGTALCFFPLLAAYRLEPRALLCTLSAIIACDFILHYHIDWAKMNLNRIKGWTATTHTQFWTLTGFDQFLHQLTYIGLIAYILYDV